MTTIFKLTNTLKAALALALTAGLLLTTLGVAQAGNPGCDEQGRPIVSINLGSGDAGKEINVKIDGVQVESVTLDANGSVVILVGVPGLEYYVELESPELTNGWAPAGGTGRVYCPPTDSEPPTSSDPPAAPPEEEELIVPETDTTDIAEVTD